MSGFTNSTEHVDWHTSQIQQLVEKLDAQSIDRIAYIRACFEFVRDEIQHTGDAGYGVITCTASEVLGHKTGYCYAKSHLFAALLRARGIATGFRYQRLYLDKSNNTFCLHGYTEVEIESDRWIRLDPRGNNQKVDVQFDPDMDCLAYQTGAGEYELKSLYADPIDIVVNTLKSCKSVADFDNKIPDALR